MNGVILSKYCVFCMIKCVRTLCVGVLFLCQNLSMKGEMPMLKEEIMEKYYSNKHTKCIPVLFVCECFTAIERVLEEVRKENPYATLAELFDE